MLLWMFWIFRQCVMWSSYYASLLATCFRGGTIVGATGFCAPSWGCCGLGMVWNARTFGIRSAICICFLLLIIRGISFFSSSFESLVLLWSLAGFCFGDLLDDARRRLIRCIVFLNYEVSTLNVEASCTPMGTTFGGIYWSMSGKKCYIKISIATLALGSQLRKKGLKGAGQEECEKEDSHSQVSSPFGS